MRLLTAALRIAPQTISSARIRGVSTSSTIQAAAATSSPSRYIRKTAIPSRSTASSSTAASKGTPRSFKPTSTPSPAPSPAPVVDEVDDFPDDFPLPTNESPIEDYAHLFSPSSSTSTSSSSSRAPARSPGNTPTASPPLTNLPGEGYSPLPTASGTVVQGDGGIQGEASIGSGTDWSSSFAGLSERPFPKEVADELLKELKPQDVEIKPDGLLYLPEIKYRRTLNAAFGPGGWGLAPRGETNVGPRIVSREWGLVCLGRLVSIARGEQEYFDPSGIPTATEACKSNALMRCCKDLGIASELWDPTFIRNFKVQHCKEVFVEHATKRTKKKLWRKKDAPKFDYPWKEGV
ncbi:uncharacterized protein IL334_007244 [Kwoniella shivajii]|uniref:Mitochondrial genome maintenance protein MGM101 n=1 Tax=Kwoniella shivajii TaxID=564305 RepID=A0ABZ1DAD5_9TREE|nr:hypothetical protein IL334_007244 [Kwoniella shivajii]